MGSLIAFSGSRCQVLMSRFHSTNSSHQQKTQEQCRVYGANDVVKDAKFTGCVTGEFVHHSHANARKRSFMPGAQKQSQLNTLIFQLNAVAVVSFYSVYSKTHDAGKHHIQHD